MESTTAQGIARKIQTKAETVDKSQLVDRHEHTYRKAQSGHTRMDKLLQGRQHANCAEQNRRAIEDAHENCYLETVENKREANMGTA